MSKNWDPNVQNLTFYLLCTGFNNTNEQIEKHELLEMRRVAAYIYKKAGRWKQSIALSKKDNLYKDCMETCSQSGDRELSEDLLVYFIEKVLFLFPLPWNYQILVFRDKILTRLGPFCEVQFHSCFTLKYFCFEHQGVTINFNNGMILIYLQGKKECFASCLFVCYDIIRPDVALELAWMNNMIDFAFPYILQVRLCLDSLN